MKKGLLLAGAVFSVLAGSANAVTINLKEGQKIKFGFRGIIDAHYLGSRSDADKSDLQFIHRDARIYAKYKLNKIVSFGFQASLWAKADKVPYEVFDSFINLALVPELNIIAGSYKVPFERHSGLQSGWSYVFPRWLGQASIDKVKHVFTNPLAKANKPFRSGSRSAGLTLWGNVAGGLFKYYAGIFDVVDSNETDPNQPRAAFSIRVQFTPTMLGYKPEKGYVLKNTYVGKKDVLTVGLSYTMQPYRNQQPGHDDQTSWGIDVMWEQKFGTLVPNLQVGYVQHNNWGSNKDDDRTGWLVQGQLLYNQKVWIGKPAVVFRYVRSEFDKNAYPGKDGTPTGDPKFTTWGLGVNYFLKGYATRISLAFENAKIDNVNFGNKGIDDSYTDVTLSIFYNF